MDSRGRGCRCPRRCARLKPSGVFPLAQSPLPPVADRRLLARRPAVRARRLVGMARPRQPANQCRWQRRGVRGTLEPARGRSLSAATCGRCPPRAARRGGLPRARGSTACPCGRPTAAASPMCRTAGARRRYGCGASIAGADLQLTRAGGAAAECGVVARWQVARLHGAHGRRACRIVGARGAAGISAAGAPRVQLFVMPAAGGAARVLPLGDLEVVGEPAWLLDGQTHGAGGGAAARCRERSAGRRDLRAECAERRDAADLAPSRSRRIARALAR